MNLKVESHTHTENVTGQFQIEYAQISNKCRTAQGIAKQRVAKVEGDLHQQYPEAIRIIE